MTEAQPLADLISSRLLAVHVGRFLHTSRSRKPAVVLQHSSRWFLATTCTFRALRSADKRHFSRRTRRATRKKNSNREQVASFLPFDLLPTAGNVLSLGKEFQQEYAAGNDVRQTLHLRMTVADVNATPRVSKARLCFLSRPPHRSDVTLS